ncbi:hypothetical protein T11_11876 [Trichinella zimbabwensis]|uniref:Uncharacterized protein n=1 Tax=Trichinella zimbabwensis TaxID=268475 RepID=A0A0V1HHD3_9BILA|nr:hypothetical protein T11_11876 [Trichinella zimbabwensis]
MKNEDLKVKVSLTEKGQVQRLKSNLTNAFPGKSRKQPKAGLPKADRKRSVAIGNQLTADGNEPDIDSLRKSRRQNLEIR